MWSGMKLLDSIDTTVMSGSPLFSPTWNMVNAVKAGSLSEEAFTERYEALMEQSFSDHHDLWMELFEEESITLLCYCGAEGFCHRFLLADLMVKWSNEAGIEAEYEGEMQ